MVRAVSRLMLFSVAISLILAGAGVFVATRHTAAHVDAVIPGVIPGVIPPGRVAAPTLGFDELLEAGSVLKPSQKVLALARKRVRMAGFMVQMELPPKGSFYLSGRPARCDEAGGGTADLPLGSVLVLSNSAKDAVIPFLSGALEVTGVLDVGNKTDSEGRVSLFRLELDSQPVVSANAARPLSN